MGVIRAFAYGHNRREAAAQAYDLAKADYLTACEWLDGTDPASVERFRAACDRRAEAFDGFMFHRFGG